MTTQNSKALGSLDIFRPIAAFLVVAIHTSPLSSLNSTADFLLTRVIARTAVPFFLMISGYFILPGYLFDRQRDFRPVLRFLKKGLLLYAAASLLYLPLNLYAGHLSHMGIRDIFRMLFFDGTFYHLWYLPASLLGVLILCLLGRRIPFGAVFGITLILYGVGLGGDSYYGIVADCPIIGAFYDLLFGIFSYTRNGIFYAPVFLAMGAYAAHDGKGTSNCLGQGLLRREFFLFCLSSAGMTAEGLLLRFYGLQRHDSMYILLLPTCYFLFRILLGLRATPSRKRRVFSTYIYILHPLMIVLVRGGAKVIHLEEWLIGNSLIHFAAVCAGSAIISAGLAMGISRQRTKIQRQPPCSL